MKHARRFAAAVMAGALAFTMLVPQSAFAAAKKTKTTPAKVVITEGMKQKLSIKGASSVKWKVGNKSVATVSSKGVVKGKKDGATTVKVTFTKNGKKQTVRTKVTVKTPEIAQDSISLAAGETSKLSISNSYKKSTYTWSSSDKKVVTVDKFGKVTAVASGSAIISVKVKIPATKTGRSKKTITSSADVLVTDGIVAATQPELTAALKRKASTLTIRTDAKTALSIPEGDYSDTSLVVYAPNADITNKGVFKDIRIHQIAADTWNENARGNIIILDAAAGHIVLPKDSNIGEVRIVNANSNFKLDIQGSVDKITIESPTKVAINVTGTVGKVDVASKAEVAIQGTSEKSIPIEINDKAAGTVVSSNVKLDVTTASDAAITVSKGAEGSTVNTSDNAARVSVDNDTTSAVAVNSSNGKSETVTAGEDASVDGNGNKTVNSTPTPVPSISSSSSSGTSSGSSSSSGTGTAGGSTSGGSSGDEPDTPALPEVPVHTGPSVAEGHSTLTKTDDFSGSVSIVSETDYLWAKKKVISVKYTGDEMTELNLDVSFFDKDGRLISERDNWMYSGNGDTTIFVFDIPDGYVTSSIKANDFSSDDMTSAYANISAGKGSIIKNDDYNWNYYEIDIPYTNSGYTEATVGTVVLVKYKGDVVSVWQSKLTVPGHSTANQRVYPSDGYISVSRELTVEAFVGDACFQKGITGENHSISYYHTDGFEDLNHFSYVPGDERIGNKLISKLKYDGKPAYCQAFVTASFYDDSNNLISSSASRTIYFSSGQTKQVVFKAPTSFAKYAMQVTTEHVSETAESADSFLTAGSVNVQGDDCGSVILNNSSSTVIDKAIVLEKYYDADGKIYNVYIDEISDIQPGATTRNFYLYDSDRTRPASVSVNIISAYKEKAKATEPVSGIFYDLSDGEETTDLNHFEVVNAVDVNNNSEMLLNFRYTGNVPVYSIFQVKYYDADKNLISKTETQNGTFNTNNQAAMIFGKPSTKYASYCVVISSSKTDADKAQISNIEIGVPKISSTDDSSDNKMSVTSAFTIKNKGTAKILLQYAIVYMKDSTPIYIDKSAMVDYEGGSTSDVTTEPIYFDKDNVPDSAAIYIMSATMN